MLNLRVSQNEPIVLTTDSPFDPVAIITIGRIRKRGGTCEVTVRLALPPELKAYRRALVREAMRAAGVKGTVAVGPKWPAFSDAKQC